MQLIKTITERMMLDKRGLPALSSLYKIELKKDMDEVEKKMYLYLYPGKEMFSVRKSWFSYNEKKGWKYECEGA